MDGTRFGRYRLIELLGEGGMGEVWRAHDTVTERVVAIKVLSAKLSKDAEFQRRFRREAQAAARLETPHVVPIHDYGEIDGRLFVCMRLIKGRDLDSVLADGPLEPARAVRIIGQVAEALHAAHEIGLIHRDIKPSNILLDDRDFAYLIDFGIARVADDTRMTKTGNTIGTFAYIAPERLDVKGEEDARVDIYSLACVLYECLTGEPPFNADTMPRLIVAHLHTPPPRPSITRPDVPAQVDNVIATGMAKDPDQRYATAIELADAARDAITTPTLRPTSGPAPHQPPSEPPAPLVPAPVFAYEHRSQPPPSLWARAPTPSAADTGAPHVAAFAAPAPQAQRPPSPTPPSPGPPTPTRAAGISRRTTLTLIGGGAVAVIAGAVGIPALVKHGPSGSSPTSSFPPTPSSSPTASARSYGAQVVLPFTGLNKPAGVAVDAAGNLYVTDWGNNRVLKLPVGSTSQEVLPFTGLNQPLAVAVDAAGNLYVNGVERVLKLAAGSSAQVVLPFTGLGGPWGVAVDAAGNLYVSVREKVVKLPAGSTTQEVLPLTGIGGGVAVDGAGNVYVVDNVNNRVLKLAAGSSTQTEVPFIDLKDAKAVAVDAAGNLYVTEWGKNRVLKLPAGSTSQEVLPLTGFNETYGVAVDAAGNVYVTDWGNDRVLKLPAQ